MTTAMQSKYAGTCQCGCTFKRGASIHYDRVARRVVKCPHCADGQPDHGARDYCDVDTRYEDDCAARCGL